MRTSDSIGAIAKALLNAQKAIKFAQTESANPYFKSKYADLPTVIDAIKPQLNANDIVYIQTPSPSEPGTLGLTTRLLHVSGEWIEDTAIVPLPKADPQGYGSAMTYTRRYSLAAITGLYQNDDDGNGASLGSKTVAMPKPRIEAPKIEAQAPLSPPETGLGPPPDDDFPAFESLEPAQKVSKVFSGKVKRPSTPAQHGMLHAKYKAAGIPEKVYRAYIKQSFGTDSTENLYMDEVDATVKWISSYESLAK